MRWAYVYWLAALAALLAAAWVARSAWLGGASRESALPQSAAPPPGQVTIVGRVVDGRDPVAGARVRIKGRQPAAQTDRQGRFVLPRPAGDGHVVTAWIEGYFIHGVPIDHRPLVVPLAKMPAADHRDYRWIDPAPDTRQEHNCGNCHEEIYRQW